MEHENVMAKEPVSVPYVVYRDAMTHDRWAIRGLIIALLITIFLLFTSNAIWLYYWNQYDYANEETVTTVDSDGDGIATFIGGDVDGSGGVNIGEGDSAKDS